MTALFDLLAVRILRELRGPYCTLYCTWFVLLIQVIKDLDIKVFNTMYVQIRGYRLSRLSHRQADESVTTKQGVCLNTQHCGLLHSYIQCGWSCSN